MELKRENVIYSTNPKMDTSGLSATPTKLGYDLKPIKQPTISGGTIYLEAIDEGIPTDKATLKRVQTLVNQGYSVDHAVDIVSREVPEMLGGD